MAVNLVFPVGSHGLLRSTGASGCFFSSSSRVVDVTTAGLFSEHRRRIAARILPALILLVIAAASRESSVYQFPCLRFGCDSGIVIKAYY